MCGEDNQLLSTGNSRRLIFILYYNDSICSVATFLLLYRCYTNHDIIAVADVCTVVYILLVQIIYCSIVYDGC